MGGRDNAGLRYRHKKGPSAKPGSVTRSAYSDAGISASRGTAIRPAYLNRAGRSWVSGRRRLAPFPRKISRLRLVAKRRPRFGSGADCATSSATERRRLDYPRRRITNNGSSTPASQNILARSKGANVTIHKCMFYLFVARVIVHSRPDHLVIRELFIASRWPSAGKRPRREDGTRVPGN